MGYKASGPFSFNRHAAPVKVIGVLGGGGGLHKVPIAPDLTFAD